MRNVHCNIFVRIEDLYDHLDFLRPTGSWKPHYQSTGGNSTSNFEKNNAS